jgi:hypothetical protein
MRMLGQECEFGPPNEALQRTVLSLRGAMAAEICRWAQKTL